MKIIMLTFHDVTAIFYSANNRSAERRQDRKKIVSTFCCCFAGYETFSNCSEEQAVNAEEKRVKLPSLFFPLLTQLWSGEFSSGRRTRSSSYRCGFCRVIAAEVDAILHSLWDVQMIAQPKGFCGVWKKCEMMYFGLFAHANIHYVAYVSFKHVFVLLMGV